MSRASSPSLPEAISYASVCSAAQERTKQMLRECRIVFASPLKADIRVSATDFR